MRDDQEPDADPAWCREVADALGSWYDAGHRDLPWRASRDPYRILVSEVMLVQTTTTAVAPFFARFLARFPNIQALARADEADVLKAWEGLGYYRRAKQLHAAAKAVVDDFGGRIPEDAEILRSLPGIGRYIAGAVLSFAFDKPAPIVEANSQRVLARLLAWPDEIDRGASQTRLWKAAENLVPTTSPGRFNQALMELGATVCTPAEPACLLCPVAALCGARRQNLQDRIPLKRSKSHPKPVEEACVLVRRDDRILMLKRAPGGLWGDFWEFPTVHLSGANPARRPLADASGLNDAFRDLIGMQMTSIVNRTKFQFGVTTHRVTLHCFESSWLSGEVIAKSGFSDGRFVTADEFVGLTAGSVTRRIARQLVWPAAGGSRRA